MRLDEDARALEVRCTESGRRRYESHPLLAAEGPVVEALAGDARAAVVGRLRAGSVHWFDLETGETKAVPLPERLPRAEQLAVHATDGGFLVVTENGLLALDARGAVRWQRDEVTFGARLVAGTDDVYWIESTGGDLIGLDAATGAEAALA